MSRINTAADNVARIAVDFPENPTTAQVLEFLWRAEAAGYERGIAERDRIANKLTDTK